MFFSDFLEAILYNNINEFLFLRHLKANLSTSKNPIIGKKITISLRNKDISLQVNIRSKHPHLEGSHCECSHDRSLCPRVKEAFIF